MFNLLARGVLVILSIAITPILVHRLGTDQYGIYALATALGAGLTNIFVLGLIPGIVAMVSRSLAEGSRQETEKVIQTAFTLFAVVGVVGAVALSLTVPLLVTRVLRIPVSLREVASIALWVSAMGLGANLVFAVFNAIPIALQRYDIVAGRIAGLTTVSMLATAVYVSIYANLTGVMLIQLVSGLAGILLYYLVSRRELAGVRFRPGFDRPTFLRLARFTAFKSLGDVALIFGSRFDQFAVGSLLNVGVAGIYAIPANACQRILQLLGEIAAPIYPRLSAVGSDEARRLLLVRGSRLVAVVASLVVVILFVLAEPVLRLWIGGDQGVLVARQAAGVFRLLLAAIFVLSLALVANLYCEAIQRPVVNNGFILLGAVLEVPVILILVRRLGIDGAALGILLTSTVQTVPFLVLMSNRVARVGVIRLIREAWAAPLTALSVTGVVGWLLARYAGDVVSLLLVATGMTIIYLVASVATGAVRAGDLEQVSRLGPRFALLPGRDLLARFMWP